MFQGEAAPAGARGGPGESPPSPGAAGAGARGGGAGRASGAPRGRGDYKSPTQASRLRSDSADARSALRPAQVNDAPPAHPLQPGAAELAGVAERQGRSQPCREALATGTRERAGGVVCPRGSAGRVLWRGGLNRSEGRRVCFSVGGARREGSGIPPECS